MGDGVFVLENSVSSVRSQEPRRRHVTSPDLPTNLDKLSSLPRRPPPPPPPGGGGMKFWGKRGPAASPVAVKTALLLRQCNLEGLLLVDYAAWILC